MNASKKINTPIPSFGALACAKGNLTSGAGVAFDMPQVEGKLSR